MRFSPSNHNLYIADLSGATANVHVYGGASGASLFALTDPTLDEPSDVAFDAQGNMYVVNPGFENVLKSVAGTQPFTQFVSPGSGGLVNPTALAFGPDGKLYVLDTTSNAEIYRYNADGSFDTAVIPSFGLFQPADLAFGPDGNALHLGHRPAAEHRRSVALHARRHSGRVFDRFRPVESNVHDVQRARAFDPRRCSSWGAAVASIIVRRRRPRGKTSG